MATSPKLLMALTGLALLAMGCSLDTCSKPQTNLYLFPKFVQEWCDGGTERVITRCALIADSKEYSVCVKAADVKAYFGLSDTHKLTNAECKSIIKAYKDDAVGDRLDGKYISCLDETTINNPLNVATEKKIVAYDFCKSFSTTGLHEAKLYRYDYFNNLIWSCTALYTPNFYSCKLKSENLCLPFEEAIKESPEITENINRCTNITARATKGTTLYAKFNSEACKPRIVPSAAETSTTKEADTTTAELETTTEDVITSTKKADTTTAELETTTEDVTTSTEKATSAAPSTTTTAADTTTEKLVETSTEAATTSAAPKTTTEEADTTTTEDSITTTSGPAPTGPVECVTEESADKEKELCTWEDTWTSADDYKLGPFNNLESQCDF